MAMSGGLILFLALLGGAVFLLSQALVIPAFGDEARTRKLLRRRLRDIESVDAEHEVASLLREKYLRELSAIERTLEKLPAMETLSRILEQAGRQTLAYRFVLTSILISIAAALISAAMMDNALLTIAVAIGGLIAPYVILLRQRATRFEKIEEQLPDAIDIMKRALRAGHPFNASLKLAADDMDLPISRELQLTFADVNYGNDLRRALLGLLLRVPSTNIMALVTAILVQKETGGNLAEIFEGLSQVIRGRFRFQRKVRTLSAEGRLSAWILALVPLVLFGVIWVTTPDYLPPLLNHPTGQKLMVGAGIMTVLGVIWMRRIIRIDV